MKHCLSLNSRNGNPGKSQVDAVKIPRMCLSKALSVTDDMKLHIFSDASEKAIAAVAYLVSEKH